MATEGAVTSGFCNNCAHDWKVRAARFASLDDLVARTRINRQEIATLAEIGALNAFGYNRREAQWQVERAVRPAGELFAGSESPATGEAGEAGEAPLPGMGDIERIAADYSGTSLTIGPHPMALRRSEMALRGVLRAIDLPQQRDGRRVRVAGAVITRQRPGTAKGFVFLTMEDETGIANIIIRPDLFARERMTIVQERFLIVEGKLQNQEGITSVRADRLERMTGEPIEVESHDFY
jgi:error-prone DNA polymerase